MKCYLLPEKYGSTQIMIRTGTGVPIGYNFKRYNRRIIEIFRELPVKPFGCRYTDLCYVALGPKYWLRSQAEFTEKLNMVETDD